MELIKLKDIKPNPDNPRVIRDEKFNKLKKSLKDFPEMMKIRPIVIDENNVILGGNMRFRALQDLGVKETYVVKISDLTEEQKKEFIIKDNLAYGEWDWDVLANEWEYEKLEEWGLDVKFLDEKDLDVNDIENILTFPESCNFIIKCENLEQLEDLKNKLNISSVKINYKDFLIKIGL